MRGRARCSSRAARSPRVGIAPLTSMYFFGPERRARRRRLPRRRARQRRAAHRQRLRRAAVAAAAQPARSVETSAFADENPRSFGLIQRARDFDAFPGRRGALRAAPRAPGSSPASDWGRGAVMLVEIPSGRRVHRQHRRLLAAGGAARRRVASTRFAYRLTWGLEPRRTLPLAPGRRHPQRPLDPRRPRAGLRRRLRPRHDRLRRSADPRLEASAGEVEGPQRSSCCPTATSPASASTSSPATSPPPSSASGSTAPAPAPRRSGSTAGAPEVRRACYRCRPASGGHIRETTPSRCTRPWYAAAADMHRDQHDQHQHRDRMHRLGDLADRLGLRQQRRDAERLQRLDRKAAGGHPHVAADRLHDQEGVEPRMHQPRHPRLQRRHARRQRRRRVERAPGEPQPAPRAAPPAPSPCEG